MDYSSEATIELPNGDKNKKVNHPQKFIRRGFVQPREPRKEKSDGVKYGKDLHSSKTSTNKCRMNRLLFLANQLSRDVNAQLLIFGYFPNKDVGSCGCWHYGESTKKLIKKPDTNNFKKYWEKIFAEIEAKRQKNEACDLDSFVEENELVSIVRQDKENELEEGVRANGIENLDGLEEDQEENAQEGATDHYIMEDVDITFDDSMLQSWINSSDITGIISATPPPPASTNVPEILDRPATSTVIQATWPATPTAPATRSATPVAPATRPATPVAPATRPATPVPPAIRPAIPATPATRPATPVALVTRPANTAAPTTRPATPVAPATRPATSVAPATRPATPLAPATRPANTAAPTIRPATPVAPATRPANTAAPTTRPANTAAPTTRPATPVAPATRPATPLAPATRPATPVAPATRPANTAAPTTRPATPVAPTTRPATPVAPATRPATSVAPATRPANPLARATRPANTAAPTIRPATPVAPATRPANTAAPTIRPATPVAPATRPANTAAPTTRPANTAAPTTRPATPVAPATRPATPVAPATRPGTPLAPATRPATPVAPATRPAYTAASTTRRAVTVAPATRPRPANTAALATRPTTVVVQPPPPPATTEAPKILDTPATSAVIKETWPATDEVPVPYLVRELTIPSPNLPSPPSPLHVANSKRKRQLTLSSQGTTTAIKEGTIPAQVLETPAKALKKVPLAILLCNPEHGTRKSNRSRREKSFADDIDSISDSLRKPKTGCAAHSCKKPRGKPLWVQCDGKCDKWFHQRCLGLKRGEITASKDFICSNCL